MQLQISDEELLKYAAKELLKVAVCPECDGSGAVAQQVDQDEYGDAIIDVHQCRWCFERDALLSNNERKENATIDSHICEECNIEMNPFAHDGTSGHACDGCGWSIDD